MISYNEIIEIFGETLICINITENLYNYRIEIESRCSSEKIEDLLNVFGAIPNRDSWMLRVTFSDDEIYHLTNRDDAKMFINEIKKNCEIFIDESIEIDVEIKKNLVKNELSIYDFDKMKEFLFQKSYSDFLELFCMLREDHEFLYLRCLNNDVFLRTNYFCFLSKNNQFSYCNENNEYKEQLLKRNQVCNINWKRDIVFVPSDFEIYNKDNISSDLIDYIETVKYFLSIMCIVDFSVFDNNLLSISIYGYRIIEEKIVLSKEFVKNDEFFKIYEWLYFDGNIFDKIQIARNILTLHCRYSEILKIDNTVLESIRSNYKLYLKENVDRYIEVANQISLFINQTVETISGMTQLFTTRFKNSLFILLTFFFTTMIMGTISAGKIVNIFNNDIAYLIYAFLSMSFLFLIVSIREYKKNKERLRKNFKRNKAFYKEFLDENDIERLFTNNYDIEEDITEMNSIITMYSLLWFFSIIAILFVVNILN